MLRNKLLIATALMTLGGFAASAFAQTPATPAPADTPPAAATAPAGAPGECSGDAATWSGCTGTLTQNDGSKYVGEFKSGKFDGKGTLTWKDGDSYVGEFKNGVRDGTGTVTLAKVAKFSGKWENGKFVGQ